MTKRRLFNVPTLLIISAIALSMTAALPASATARFVALQADQPVNVSVGFNAQVPLADLSEESLAQSQKAAREYIYRMGKEECAVLKAVIAKTCRLTNLNISTQMQHQGNANSPILYINGNANFTISLKDDAEN
jgi:hypothetical protein